MRALAVTATALALPLALSGCIAKDIVETAVAVVKIPVQIASAGVDAVTTSQSEADEKRGRELRKAEEKRGREARAAAEAAKKAAEHSQSE